ncbi:MAG TPA: chromate transporter [Candidatus Flavonifractor merdavium]|nr:chromate transporter [Candidatus Flavonifractor merdavium]
MIYLQLLWSFFQIGLFSIGGGYAAMPLIQHQVVDLHPWLTMTEFADIMTIAEMTPGPIAINSATFVGIQVAGIPGALVATLGCVLPSCVIVTLLACVYYRFKGLSLVQGVLLGLRPAVVATIASAGLSLLAMAFYGTRGLPVDFTTLRPVPVVIFAVGLLVLRRWKVNPIWVMVGAGVAGLVLYQLV